ncbi:hypothetical protein PAXINDRAFT_80186 [Paxillus involutus ATCC 200175]|uniref:non-specific serine/threonine protein kinase n=1 Tax=Paxillus involutus ATCC 200175 TaxID=664439 RepID=A0A0C9U398_PAXIN|nr:hypothetical protein PAXINDRAFT_80186 [Paxillus involutus ATCC 200175]
MKGLDAASSRSTRRPPVRIDAQEGPWSISVAETPHDARSYSIYIKTPTHNLTLMRTATEVVELHAKLGDSDGATNLPQLPIDVAFLPTPPIKRKSTFLNTLSRLASPSTNKVSRQMSVRSPSNPNFGTHPAADQTTPFASPSQEIGDPFASLSQSTASVIPNGKPANTTMTALAAYLTTVSNEPSLRQTRSWKRFVRVRTDDLESVRVERAIKRVRSDLAAHASPKPADLSTQASSTNVSSSNVSEMVDGVESINGTVEEEIVSIDPSRSDLREEGIKEEEEADAVVPSPATKPDAEPAQSTNAEIPDSEATEASPVDSTMATPEQIDIVTNEVVEEEDTTLPTPVADFPASRIPRSHSADPDKASRLSRAYTSSTLQDGASSATGDESSISTTAGRRSRKKRSQSTDPNRKKKSQRKVAVDDFEMMRVLGKGCAGKVLLVRHKMSSDLYALKAITKRHVLAHQELQHTLTEQAVLKRMSKEAKDPFVVKLWWSFHDKENLFLVMDFHPGGDLATQLARWGRLGRDRARFYAAEIVEGVEGLHAAGVIYRDLKPENILIGADGHIVLTDFGLSKEFPRRSSPSTAPPTPSGTRGEFFSAPSTEPATPPWMKGEKGQEISVGWGGQAVGLADTTTTFCGTAEYLAPEVIQGLPYSYEVDWWSFGTMLYEMLTGITPFWANNHSDMYVRVLQDELQFPDDRAMDQDTKSLIRGLLQRNPALRMCEPRIKRHPYFSMIDWSHVYYKRYIPPYIPPIDPSNASDTQNFDDLFLVMEPVIDDPNDQEQTDTDPDREQTDIEPIDGEDAYPTPSHSRSPSVHPEENIDVFDGYSFKGRHSVILDEEEDEASGESGEEESDEEDIPSILTDVIDIPAQQAEQAEVVTESPVAEEETVEVEPKTPEARPLALPEEAHPPAEEKVATPVEPTPVVDISSTPRISKETPAPVVPVSLPKEPAPPLPAKDPKPKAAKPPVSSKSTVRNTRGRREKSGVPALDRFLSDDVEGEGDLTEKEEEDDDWDFIEADGEDRNGTKGTTSLFARGVVDRYRLAVFRKASTPSQRVGGRSFSGLSKESDLHAADPVSPTPSEKRRGRAPGLKFRKTPQFLKGKSPPSSFSAKSAPIAKTPTPSTAATTATISSMSSNGLLTPSVSAASTMPMSPSLRSKESALSVGNQSQSSDQSNGETAELPSSHSASPEARKVSSTPHTEEPEKLRNKKLKKYKENAEKVLSLFASPRQS